MDQKKKQRVKKPYKKPCVKRHNQLQKIGLGY